MIHETLYKRTKTGAIQYWKIETRDALGSAQIRKESGQFGTPKPTVHVEPVHEGKNIGRSNETTPLQQAESQALSDWTKKHDEGYKSLKDLNIIIVGPTDEDYQKHSTEPAYASYMERLQKLLDEALPQFNTDATGKRKPMKAPTKPWKAGKKLNWPQQEEPKMDGNRALLKVEQGVTGMTALFYSSGGKVISTLNHLLDIILQSSLGTVPGEYDGEIYCHGMTLQQINSAVKSLKPSSLKLKFHIFDMPGIDDAQEVRSEAARQATIAINHTYFPILEVVTVHNEAEVLEHHDRWVGMGYEGGMLKDPKGVYQSGQRSSYWNKVKMFDDDEFLVVGYELGQRGAQDLSFVCKSPAGIFNAAMNGSIEEKEEMVADIESYIGKQLTVKYFGFTDKGIPNLPKGKAFRDYEN